jgi:hypothetical protein
MGSSAGLFEHLPIQHGAPPDVVVDFGRLKLCDCVIIGCLLSLVATEDVFNCMHALVRRNLSSPARHCALFLILRHLAPSRRRCIVVMDSLGNGSRATLLNNLRRHVYWIMIALDPRSRAFRSNAFLLSSRSLASMCL